MIWRGLRLNLVLGGVLVLGFGVLLSVLIRESMGPLTGGSGSRMPGMTMPSAERGLSGVRSAELQRAHADVEAGRLAEAMPVYERALQEDPHNMEALIHLGMCLAGTGDIEGGLAHMDRALAMEPDNLHALWVKALTLFEAKED